VAQRIPQGKRSSACVQIVCGKIVDNRGVWWVGLTQKDHPIADVLLCRTITVIPAQAGIQLSGPCRSKLDSRLRGNDKLYLMTFTKKEITPRSMAVSYPLAWQRVSSPQAYALPVSLH